MNKNTTINMLKAVVEIIILLIISAVCITSMIVSDFNQYSETEQLYFYVGAGMLLLFSVVGFILYCKTFEFVGVVFKKQSIYQAFIFAIVSATLFILINQWFDNNGVANMIACIGMSMVTNLIYRLLIRAIKNKAKKQASYIMLIFCIGVLTTLSMMFAYHCRKQVFVFVICIHVVFVKQLLEDLQFSLKIKNVLLILYLCFIGCVGSLLHYFCSNKESGFHNISFNIVIIYMLLLYMITNSYVHTIYIHAGNNYSLNDVQEWEIVTQPSNYVEDDTWERVNNIVILKQEEIALDCFEVCMIETDEMLEIEGTEYCVFVYDLKKILVVTVSGNEDGKYETVTDIKLAMKIVRLAEEHRVYQML